MSTSGGVTLLPVGIGASAIIQAGQWYPFPTQGNSTFTPANGTLDALPFYVPTSHTFVSISINVTAAATGPGIAELGIFNDNGTGYPGTRLNDYGSVSTAAIAGPSIAIGQLLPIGLYWLAALYTGATTVPTITRIASGPSDVTGMASPFGVGGWGGYRAAGVAGPGLPATFPAAQPLAQVTWTCIQA